jgi:hypothetical protein
VDDYSQKAVVLRLSADASTKLRVACEKPSKCEVAVGLDQLAESGEMLFTGPFPLESAMLHRVVFADHYESEFTIDDTGRGERADWYYVRVIQANGEMAWSSPVWVEKA